jgi:integrase
MAGRIPHDLRRSGVKHYIDAGVDPHTVMLWSGHRTEATLRRYHIVDPGRPSPRREEGE